MEINTQPTKKYRLLKTVLREEVTTVSKKSQTKTLMYLRVVEKQE